MPDNVPSNRREFLRGKALQDDVRRTGDAIADSVIGHVQSDAPESSDTLRLTQRSMACDFSVIMNAGEHESIWSASGALDLVSELETQLSVYQPDSEICRLNRDAHASPQTVEGQLFELLVVSKQIAKQTGNAFDLTTDPLIQLWRECRAAVRVPAHDEVHQRLANVGMQNVVLDELQQTLSLSKPGTSINLGAIGKGYALDRMAEWLTSESKPSNEDTTDAARSTAISQTSLNRDFLLHGGQSSLLASGRHTGCDGWPVGIGNPLFTDRRLGTIILRDQALATSGSNIQYYRVGGRRYGHILDPRTGWPVDGTLSVTAIAETATKADALSTAFYVMEPDQIAACCQAEPGVGAILIPLPTADRRVQPIVFGIDPQQIFWDSDQIRVPEKQDPTSKATSPTRNVESDC